MLRGAIPLHCEHGGTAQPAPRNILLPLPTKCLTATEGSDKGPSDNPTTERETMYQRPDSTFLNVLMAAGLMVNIIVWLCIL